MLRIATLLLAALLIAACDATYNYGVWNETGQPVIVETHHDTVSISRVESGEHAQVVQSGFGGTNDPSFYMEIFTTECDLLATVDLPTSSGTVLVVPDDFMYIDREEWRPAQERPPPFDQLAPGQEAEPCSS